VLLMELFLSLFLSLSLVIGRKLIICPDVTNFMARTGDAWRVLHLITFYANINVKYHEQ